MTYWDIKPKMRFKAKGIGNVYEIVDVRGKQAQIRLLSPVKPKPRVIKGLAWVNRASLAQQIESFLQ